MPSPINLFRIAVLALTFCCTLSAGQADSGVESRRKALNDLLGEQWDYHLRANPLFASFLGDKRWNAELDDFSQAAIDNDLLQTQKFLTRFEAIDTTGFSKQDILNKRLMVRDLKMQLEAARFRPWEMPVDSEHGWHIDLPQMPTFLSFRDVKDYEDYIARLKQIPRLLDQTIIQMKKGMADGLMPPAYQLQRVVEQANGIASQPPSDSPFALPFKEFPYSISEPEQTKLREQGMVVIHAGVLPAYAHFAGFVRDDYAPRGRKEPGVWSLPDGDGYYAFRVKDSTTTYLTPEQIHNLGLIQVMEIEGRMKQVAAQLGYKDLKTFNAAIAANPKLHGHSRKQILDLYTKYVEQMSAKLPDLFGHIPKAKIEVMQVEEFREKEAGAASYQAPALDGSRPGRIMVNTGDSEKRLLLKAETIAYHEGVPGHHMQIATAQELPQLPPFRQNEYFTAFTEGWALYAERLGKEAGFFQDPYSYYGYLQNDMLRAIRLVVDTGVHYKHWTRQQVIDYFHEHSGEDELTVQSETDYYIAAPAQALGYKIGQLEILDLRQYAKDQLGDKFDIRSFHDEVLNGGAVPMDVLKERIQAWVALKVSSSPSMAKTNVR